MKSVEILLREKGFEITQWKNHIHAKKKSVGCDYYVDIAKSALYSVKVSEVIETCARTTAFEQKLLKDVVLRLQELLR